MQKPERHFNGDNEVDAINSNFMEIRVVRNKQLYSGRGCTSQLDCIWPLYFCRRANFDIAF